MENKKYEFTDETISLETRTLHRIRALRDFGIVKKGDLGGFIESERNLSHEGLAWVFSNARVCDDAQVWNNATIYGCAQIYGNALICNDARIFGNAQVRDYAVVRHCAQVSGNSQIYNTALIYNNAQIYGNAQVFGTAQVGDSAAIYGKARISGKAQVFGKTQIFGKAYIRDKACVYGNARVGGDALIYGDACIAGCSLVWDNAAIYGNAKIFDTWVDGRVSIYGDVWIDEKAKISNGAEIRSGNDYLVIKNIGSRHGTTTFFRTNRNEIYVNCGCFYGSINKFLAKVANTHGANKYGDEYRLACKLAELHIHRNNK